MLAIIKIFHVASTHKKPTRKVWERIFLYFFWVRPSQGIFLYMKKVFCSLVKAEKCFAGRRQREREKVVVACLILKATNDIKPYNRSDLYSAWALCMSFSSSGHNDHPVYKCWKWTKGQRYATKICFNLAPWQNFPLSLYLQHFKNPQKWFWDQHHASSKNLI